MMEAFRGLFLVWKGFEEARSRTAANLGMHAVTMMQEVPQARPIDSPGS